MYVLGIETSCDETAAAVIQDGPRIVSNVIHSQVSIHALYGGVVPEVASREHISRVVPVVRQALEQAGGIEKISGIAVTRGPGLVGALLVGLQFAKGLSMARQIPWIGINHLEGHLAAALLAENPPTYPYVALVASGGHTHLYHVLAFGDYVALGGTRDDAAGEAFDKVAKLLGLGYPGGVQIERASKGGDPNAVPLPRALPSKEILDFSFSGLKTAAARYLKQFPNGLNALEQANFCASMQEAVADILVKKLLAAAKQTQSKGVIIAGGVAANQRLRECLQVRAQQKGLWCFLMPRHLCTDNAAMIASAGWVRLRNQEHSDFRLSAISRWPLGDQSALDHRVKPWQ